MRILHTSDWHVGKRLGRWDRMDDHAAAIDQVIGIAGGEEAHLVLHSGDLFDRPLPPVDALRLALDGLIGLAAGGTRPVVVVAGNHDSPALFEALAPLLVGFGVHLVGRIKAPDAGGVLTVATGSGPAHVACLPFLRAAQTVDFTDRADKWYGAYADRVRQITEAYAAAVGERAGDSGVGLLVGHWMVGGVAVRAGAPRGERELHLGEAYAATGASVPAGMDYVALGHIHAPQPVPGAQVPAEYAGSLLQLDFGEAGEDKRVVIVDAEPNRPAVVRSIPVTAGRRLVQAAGSWEALAARRDLDDAYLDLAVETDGPAPGLMDQARERFAYVVKVQARYDRPDRPSVISSNRPLADLYAEYHEVSHGMPAPPELITAFRALEEEVTGASD
jgi:exonuclease SbcD